jgi:hypothetical protein
MTTTLPDVIDWTPNPNDIEAEIITALHRIARVPADYPAPLRDATLARLLEQVRSDPDEVSEVMTATDSRIQAIEEALQDPFIAKQEALALIDELAELITQEGKE